MPVGQASTFCLESAFSTVAALDSYLIFIIPYRLFPNDAARPKGGLPPENRRPWVRLGGGELDTAAAASRLRIGSNYRSAFGFIYRVSYLLAIYSLYFLLFVTVLAVY